MRRWLVLAFSLGLLALVASPMFGRPGADSYPLSSYPMFASDRGSVSTFYGALGVEADGGRTTLRPRVVGGTGEIVHAAESVRFAIRTGSVAGLCAEIAERVDSAEFDGIEVISERIDALDWFAGDEVPLETTVHAECTVS